jgi:DNA-binding MarR family transcriptional regulator
MTLPKISSEPGRPATSRGTTARSSAPSAAESDLLLHALRRVMRELRLAARDAEQRAGIPPAEHDVLMHLADEKVGSLSALAERTHTDLSSVSVVVSRLAERGLLRRTVDAADRRRLVIELTPAGRAVVRRAPESTRSRFAHAVSRLSRREQRTTNDTLERLADALEADGRGR